MNLYYVMVWAFISPYYATLSLLTMIVSCYISLVRRIVSTGALLILVAEITNEYACSRYTSIDLITSWTGLDLAERLVQWYLIVTVGYLVVNRLVLGSIASIATSNRFMLRHLMNTGDYEDAVVYMLIGATLLVSVGSLAVWAAYTQGHAVMETVVLALLAIKR